MIRWMLTFSSKLNSRLNSVCRALFCFVMHANRVPEFLRDFSFDPPFTKRSRTWHRKQRIDMLLIQVTVCHQTVWNPDFSSQKSFPLLSRQTLQFCPRFFRPIFVSLGDSKIGIPLYILPVTRLLRSFKSISPDSSNQKSFPRRFLEPNVVSAPESTNVILHPISQSLPYFEAIFVSLGDSKIWDSTLHASCYASVEISLNQQQID